MKRAFIILISVILLVSAVSPCFADSKDLAVSWNLADSNVSYYSFGFRSGNSSQALSAEEAMTVNISGDSLTGSLAFEIFWEIISSLNVDLELSISGPMMAGENELDWTITPEPSTTDDSLDVSWGIDSSDNTKLMAVIYKHEAANGITGTASRVEVSANTVEASGNPSGSYRGSIVLDVHVR